MQENTKLSTGMPTITRSEYQKASPIYILLLIGLFSGVGLIAALIYSYVLRREFADSEILRGHCRFVIRTCWVTMIGLMVGLILGIVFIGYFIFVGFWLWCCYRLVRGGIKLYREQPIY